VQRLSTLSAVVALLLPTTGTPYMRGYLPLKDNETAKRFPLRVLRANFTQGTGAARVGSTTVRFLEVPNAIQFTGVDTGHKPWTVTADAMRGGALYSADLDKNGSADLIYAAYTGGNGLAPPMHVLTLLFDATGRPVPCEMDGYFEVDGRGLMDLIDLDGDGRAELIRQAYDDGYWITSMYEARDAHWHRISGEHASRTFPIYTRFTNRANRVATTPAPGRHPVEDDLSNDITAHSGRLTAIHWANVAQSQNPQLDLSDGSVCVPVAWYSSMVVVQDTPGGRNAATLGAPEEAHRLLNEIVRAKVSVDIRGSRRYAVTGVEKPNQAQCIPETIWASMQ
jgi:hypothetical protein